MNKGRRNFYFRPGVVQLKSNFRHWNSSRIFPPSHLLSPRNLSFVPLDLSGRYSPSVCTSFRIKWYFYFAPIRMAGAKLPRFAYTWEIRKVRIYWFFFFFSIPPLIHIYTDRYIFVLWFFILPFVFLFCTGFTLLHNMSDRHRSRIKSNRRFNIDGPSSFNFRPDVLVFLRTFLRGSDMLWGNRFPFFFCLRQREILLTAVSFRSPVFPAFFFLWFLFSVVHQGEIDL